MKKIIILLFLIPTLAFGSYDFNNSTASQVDHGSATSLDDMAATTVCAWIWFDSVSASGRIYQKGYIAAHSTFNYFTINSTISGIEIGRDMSGTDTIVQATLTNFSAYGLNKWIFTCMDITFGSGTPHIWMGDTTKFISEPSSYANQNAGTGTVVTDATAPFIVGQRGGASIPLDAKIFWIGVWNRQLSKEEMKQQQFNPHVTSGNVIFAPYGLQQGLSTTPDWSGKRNAGTVTSVPVIRNAPIRIYR